MPTDIETRYRTLLEAVSFAARAHQGQRRKDGQTPYAAHVFRVCLIVREVFGIDDPAVLTAAVLHDTVEDTTTDFDDLQEHFGAQVAGWVGTLSKDKRLEYDEREKQYAEGLARADWRVKVCKLADIVDNLMDSGHLTPERRPRTLRNSRRYLDALKRDLPEQARAAWALADRFLGEYEKGQAGGQGGQHNAK